jgi:hypothetical protein
MPSPALSWVSFAVLSATFLGIYDVAKKALVQDNAVLVVLFACRMLSSAQVLCPGRRDRGRLSHTLSISLVT